MDDRTRRTIDRLEDMVRDRDTEIDSLKRLLHLAKGKLGRHDAKVVDPRTACGLFPQQILPRRRLANEKPK